MMESVLGSSLIVKIMDGAKDELRGEPEWGGTRPWKSSLYSGVIASSLSEEDRKAEILWHQIWKVLCSWNMKHCV